MRLTCAWHSGHPHTAIRARVPRGEACLPAPSPSSTVLTASGVVARVRRCNLGIAALLPLNGSSSCSSAAVSCCAAAPPRRRARALLGFARAGF